MPSPTSLTHRCLLPRKALCKFRRACLISPALDHCALWSAALLSASLQVSWEIHDARAFVVCGFLVTSPLRSTKAAYPLVWGRTAFGRIGQQVRPRW